MYCRLCVATFARRWIRNVFHALASVATKDQRCPARQRVLREGLEDGFEGDVIADAEVRLAGQTLGYEHGGTEPT